MGGCKSCEYITFNCICILFAVFLAFSVCLNLASAQAPGPEKAASQTPPKSVAELLSDLNSPNPSVASNAIVELKGAKMAPKDALPALISALKNQSEFVRLGAANAIAEFGPEAVPALNSLLGALKDKDALVREAAALAILGIGQGLERDRRLGRVLDDQLFAIDPA